MSYLRAPAALLAAVVLAVLCVGCGNGQEIPELDNSSEGPAGEGAASEGGEG